jgi:type I restriction-modification system DNA methylase subunit
MTKSLSLLKRTYSIESNRPISELFERLLSFNEEVDEILSKYEISPKRAIVIEGTYRKLNLLNSKQEQLIRESLKCIEYKLFRAAHVLAWSAFIDFLEDLLLKKIHTSMTKEKLQDTFGDSNIIDQLKSNNLITAIQQRSIRGLLYKRNECAHPSPYEPDINQTLGYVSEIIDRLKSVIEQHQ